MSHDYDTNNSESEHRQEKRQSRSVKKSCKKREANHVSILHAVVPHLPKTSMRLGKERYIRKHTEEDNPRK